MKWGTGVLRCLLTAGAGSVAALVSGSAGAFAAPAITLEPIHVGTVAMADETYVMTAVTYISVLTIVAIALVMFAHLVHRGEPVRSQLPPENFLSDVLGFHATRDGEVDASGGDIDLTRTAEGGIPVAAFTSSSRHGRPLGRSWPADQSREPVMTGPARRDEW